jgi:uncharacterized membrane protein
MHGFGAGQGGFMLLSIVRIIAVVASGSGVALSLPQWRQADFWLTATAAAAIVFAFAITRFINYPINDALMTWSVTAPPPNVRELWVPWEQAHTLRSAASVAAFALQVIALGVSAR